MISMQPTRAVAEMWPQIAEVMGNPESHFDQVCRMSGGLEGSFEQQD